MLSLSARRAWIEIGLPGADKVSYQSLSARRAWIEILFHAACPFWKTVALRKESVDRNSIALASFKACTMSLSARRAWIEISCCSARLLAPGSSLSARRAWIEIHAAP